MMGHRMVRGIVKLAGVVMGLLALLVLARPAAAGGWVVISLDEVPGSVEAGETMRVGFMVRAHGVTPINDVTPVLTAANAETGETITAEAQQAGETGHFEVAVVFPTAGTWEWRLGAPPFPRETTFVPITVLPAAGGESALPVGVTAGAARAAMRWAGVGLLGVAAVLAFIGRRRRGSVPAPEAAGSGV